MRPTLQTLAVVALVAAACTNEPATIVETGEPDPSVITTGTFQRGAAPDLDTTEPSLSTTEPPSEVAPIERLSEPPGPPPLEVGNSFVRHLASDDLRSAADMWSGYPDAWVDTNSSDDNRAERDEAVAAWAQHNEWLFDPAANIVRHAVPAFGFTPEFTQTVVTFADLDAQRTVSLLVAVDGELLRLQMPDTRAPVSPISVMPGEELRFDGIPVEGHAVAYVDGVALTDITVDHDELETRIVLPDVLPPTSVLTLSFATPEYPSARSIILVRA